MMFSPRIDGSVPTRTGPVRFLEGFRRRLEAGLVSGQPQPRSRYLVTRAADTRIEVAAAFAVGLSGVIGITLAATFWWLDLPVYVERNPHTMIPGLSTRTSVGLAWGMVAFWSLVWPWLLIALHEPALRRLIEGIIRDVDTHEGPEARAGSRFSGAIARDSPSTPDVRERTTQERRRR